MIRILVLAVLVTASPALAQTKYTKATTVPPPGHSCADLYRSRDDASRYGALYDRSDATVVQPMSCEASANRPPDFLNRPRPRQ